MISPNSPEVPTCLPDSSFASRPLICVGGGNMAHAILSRAIPAGVCPKHTVVVDPNPERRALFPHAATTLDDALASIDTGNPATPCPWTLMLAVKPQIFPEIARVLSSPPAGRSEGAPGRGPSFAVSIMAGVRSTTIANALPGHPPTIRVMPNTPAQVGEGMSALARGAGVGEAELDAVRSIFEAVGKTIDLDESLLDAFTALAGSGPAYLFYLAEAMETAAARMGFPPGDARAIVAQTLRGSGTLLSGAGLPPAELRARVTSRGGTTAAACDRLDEEGVMDSLILAILRAEARGRELADGG